MADNSTICACGKKKHYLKPLCPACEKEQTDTGKAPSSNAIRLRAPDSCRAAFIRAGRAITHAEIVRIDGDGVAHCHTEPAAQALRYEGFKEVG